MRREVSYSLATVAGTALMDEGADTWYFVSQDSAFGRSLEADLQKVIENRSGKVFGISRFPITNQDFTSQLLAAQSSNAKVIALTAGDIPSAMKQANEFGIMTGGQKVTSLLLWIQMVKAMGPKLANGLYLSEPFYWDLNDQTREWSKKFYERAGFMPSMTQAGSYSATKHYLRAVQKAGTTDQEKVIVTIRSMPVEDATGRGEIRPDGLVARDFYLFQVKSPAESKSEWDLYKYVRTVPAALAAPPLAQSECPAVSKP